MGIERSKMDTNSNDHLRAAVDQLEIISQDEQKRLEYTARQKAIGDYNTLMRESREDGIEEGMAKGRAELREEKIAEMRKLGFTEEQIKALWG
jgi:flagellar biosynthesis/type III secretory pathway protein FliH